MKRCTSCGQIVAQRITTCPACGSQLVAGMTAIDDYKIQNIVHEGRSSLVCRAIKKDHKKPVSIRLFTEQSGVTDAIAQRLEKELKTLAKLPEDLFVQHYAIKKSSTGHWYRVSEWVDAGNWGSIFVSGTLKDQRRMVTLFHNIASALDILHHHDHFMPYLILDDILIPRNQTKNLGVKINYKLSRFLNARATHHGPMLKKLLECHPDIVNERAIDFRTGIWSLGKLFVELLTADHNLTQFSSKLDQLKGLDPELTILIKVMLSDDPDLRPQSMTQITAALSRILDQLPHKTLSPYKGKPKLLKEIIGFKRIIFLLLFVIVGILGVNTFLYMDKKTDQEEAPLSQFLASHTGAIGFLMVEYWLETNDKIIYKNKVEGTAFLVDHQGYLLTNRHVACPWLEDATLFQIRQQLGNRPIEFGHRMFLWFEGTKAFNRLSGLGEIRELADVYYLAGAFRSHGKSNLRVVGVPRGAVKTGDRLDSPFKNDFAVLKIDILPKGLTPLPLETQQESIDIKRLSPVVIMGFPLGSRTQDDRINVSITRGHVRRTSKELIQVDSSIYKGNSGGPAVNARGRVIGIASGVVTDQPSGQIPLRTPLSDFGLVLPISRPAQFVESLKTGQPKWNGILDFTLDKKLDQILAMAIDHDYKSAAALAHTQLNTSQDPALLFTTALMDFCNADMEQSRKLFTRLLSIEGENTVSRLMLHIIDWITDQDKSREATRQLLTMTWTHPDEFSGYLARTLKNREHMSPDFIDYENRSEKSWRLFMEGLIQEKNKAIPQAIASYKQIVLSAGANDHLYLMAFSRLNSLMNNQGRLVKDKEKHMADQNTLWEKADKQREKSKKAYVQAVTLIRRFESPKTNHGEKIKTYETLLDLSPANQTIVGRVAFFHATHSEWEKSLFYIDQYFAQGDRETALSLSLGLLKGQILKIMGKNEAAQTQLKQFQSHTRDPWYGIISKHLLSEPRDGELVKLAGNNPAKLITLHTALGLDAEARKDREGATRHYREALGTYLDNWNEYDLARARIIGFRQEGN